MIRRTLCSLVLAVVAIGVLHAAGVTTAPAPDPVKDCPAGLVCFTIKEQAGIDRRLAEYDRMKARKHLLGWHATCGLALAGVVDENFSLRAVPAGYCGVGFGF